MGLSERRPLQKLADLARAPALQQGETRIARGRLKSVSPEGEVLPALPQVAQYVHQGVVDLHTRE